MLQVLRSVVLKGRRGFAVGGQLCLIALSNAAAFLLRFDGSPPPWALEAFWQALPWLVAIRAVIFIPFRLYEGLWRYTSLWDLKNLLLGIGVSSTAFVLFQTIAFDTAYPRSVYIMDAVLLVLALTGVRLMRRLVAEVRQGGSGRRVLIYGAGDAGELVVRDMRRKTGQHDFNPIGFVDDDQAKTGQRIHGLRVFGTRTALAQIIAQHRPDEILLAIPRADPVVYRDIVRSLERFKIPIKTLPTLRDLLDDKLVIDQIRNVSVEDLLSRGTVGLDVAPLTHFLKGRRVMVTGAGGSIGSELCRQIATLGAGTLIVFERHENSLYHIVNQLNDLRLGVQVCAIIGDATDESRVDAVMRDYQPEIVFHAAAHKHVPLMEDNACEAVKNNVGGTRVVAQAAERHGVDRFILISTDKAVNPTSVMGATKRVAELMLLTQSVGSGTSFMSVRFGNVLASAGSVVPRFLQQIRAGGPVTVTHPEMRRYFMLIPEAVQLVLHAAAHGEGGKLYVLEMGEQVKLVDMARDLIRQAGFVPDVEIPITFVGTRPGEKLYEELVGPDEVVEASAIPKVMQVTPVRMVDPAKFVTDRNELERSAQRNDADGVMADLRRLVPSFEVKTGEQAIAAGVPVPVVSPARERPDLPIPSQCPRCQAKQLYHTRVRTWLEDWRNWLSLKSLYKCRACGWRGWLTPLEPAVDSASLDWRLPTDLASLDDRGAAPLGTKRPAFSPRDLPSP